MTNGDPKEPDLSFASARLKIRWAEHNIKEIIAWANKFINQQNQAAGLTADRHGVMHAEPINPFFAMHVGDAIFSLRSALDCCWMGLKRAADASADKGTLPRTLTRNELEGTLKNASVEDAFKGSDHFILDQIKPYRDGNEILWFGGQVDNWNKHNMIILTKQETFVQSLVLSGLPGSNIGTITVTDCKFDGYAVGGLIQANEPLRPHLDNQPDMTTGIILISRKPPNERPLVPFLTALLKESHEAVELFVSTFGKQTA